MQTRTALALIVVAVILLAGCSPLGGSDGGELVSPIWTLTTLNGRPPLPTTSITAQFGDDGMVSGSAGCNNYSAPFEVSGAKIEVGPVASTMKACQQPVMTQEADFLAALETAARFEVKVDTLTLYDEAKTELATFQVVEQTLAGSSWQVLSFNNGRGGVTSVILGTEITAQFGEDGQVIGNAGCNNYFGPYKVDGDSISIGPLGATRKLCNEPEGIMQQEQEYLAALETAATYRIEGATMEMRTAQGSLVANFRRAAGQ